MRGFRCHGGTSIYIIATMFPPRKPIGHGCIPPMLKILIKQGLLGFMTVRLIFADFKSVEQLVVNYMTSSVFEMMCCGYIFDQISVPFQSMLMLFVCPVAGVPRRASRLEHSPTLRTHGCLESLCGRCSHTGRSLGWALMEARWTHTYMHKKRKKKIMETFCR